MKTLVKVAMGVALAVALIKLLSKARAGRRADAGESLPAGEGATSSMPVETLSDSAGTALSASPVVSGTRH